ncbi:MAG: threonine/serine exporter family protein [Candidatus Amulumruptor caecigallinarius]|nr:threonine/serine exporter family protein [Candidatus Amulumruptor caecigallinarius]MCM1396242.1 threonine/serine exporter family protein [Candidatus Amulumruptor caecigallinarius]MCM1453758.1 threonine/serine exporter family protein [bacterium]
MTLAFNILIDALLAAVAAIGFGAVSNPSVRTFPYIAVLAAVGHALRYVLMEVGGCDIVTSSLAAAVTIGTLALLFGKLAHTPLPCLFIPALLPMVPGMYAYKCVFALIMFIQSIDSSIRSEEYLLAFASNFAVTVMVIGVLAGGASLPTFIFRRLTMTMTRYAKGPEPECDNTTL